MGLVRDAFSKSIEFVREEILPLREELVKAGIITPEKTAYDMKASLVDPWAYGQMSYGYKEKYSILDYPKCRQITYADPVVAAVIQTRLNQVAGFSRVQPDKYKMGFKVKMRDNEAEPKDADKTRIKEITTFIQNCGVPENFEDTPELKRRDSFEMFLRKITRDTLTFDQINFEIIPRKDGKPYAFQAVDAATIRVIPDLKESIERFETKEREINVIDFGNAQKEFKQFKPEHPRFCQVIGGVVRHVFDEWEMAFGVRNPRTDLIASGYGFSEIEMLVTTITSHMNAETYNRKFFSQGSTIKGVLAFEGSVPPDQLEAFRRQWYQQVTGVNNSWRTPILALGKESKLNWTSLHSTNREMEFGKWMEYCIKTICGVFQIDPIEIGFDISKQGSGQTGGSAGLGQGNQAERVSFSQDKGLRPLLLHIQGLINDYIVYRIDPNYEFEFVGLNVNSEKDDLDRAVQQGKSFKTINEIRSEHDLEDIDLEKIKKNPGEMILDPSFIQYITGVIQSEKEEEQQAAGMGPDGQPAMGPDGQPMPGGPPGEGGPPGQEEPGKPSEEEGPEPDYENMSTEELQAELDKLEQPASPPPGKKPPMGKAQPPVSKSVQNFYREIEL
jgi:hypothetical protein